MPTTFIAVQCFQCCTMQVKQQKKSSNKWICVVCNQKQSLRKVFAQSPMAKDVRKVVQSFNMARQLSDQRGSHSEEPEASGNLSDDGERRKSRNDWSEYVDNRDECDGKFEDTTEGGDSGVDGMVVTEISKALFRKPKVKDYSSSGCGSGKMFKPLFPDRRNAKRHRIEFSQDTQSTEFQQMSCEIASKESDSSNGGENASLHVSDRAPKWNRFKAQMEEKFVRQSINGDKGAISKSSDRIRRESENYNATGQARGQLQHTAAAAKGTVSKWSSFITEEDDYESLGSGRARDLLGVASKPMSIKPLETLMNDDKVDEDVHPDFL